MARKRTQRRYSDEERAEAVAAVAANAGNVSGTANRLGIPEKTLRRWVSGIAHPEAVASAELKKPPLADRFDAIAHRLLDVADKNLDRLNAKDAIVAAAVAVDKARLLRGEPTAIDEKRDDTRLNALRARYAALHAPGDPGADAGVQPVRPAPPDAEAARLP